MSAPVFTACWSAECARFSSRCRCRFFCSHLRVPRLTEAFDAAVAAYRFLAATAVDRAFAATDFLRVQAPQ